MRASDFDFNLPPELIAQTPAAARDASRLLVLHRGSGEIEHRRFSDLLNYISAGDVLVLNDSRVIPARLRGINSRTGGQFEILLLEEISVSDWWVMLRPGNRARPGTQILIRGATKNPSQILAAVIDTNPEGHRRLQFTGTTNILSILEEIGEVPLPPYIVREDPRAMIEDRERYQTVFARPPGSVAAPTAGLHFTKSLLEQAQSRGIQICFVTLHVGLGTFAPVKSERLENHIMHEERYELSPCVSQAINKAKSEGRRIFAAGTTTLRALESAADREGQLAPGSGKTRLFVHPPYDFKITDALLTNFHLPRSTLLMLVSAFAAPNETHGRDMILNAYAEAVREQYRFFSYGDAMLIL